MKGDKGKKVVLTWHDKKALADKEEDDIEKEIQEQSKWISVIENMGIQELKNYLENRTEHLKTVSVAKCEANNRVKRRIVKNNC